MCKMTPYGGIRMMYYNRWNLIILKGATTKVRLQRVKSHQTAEYEYDPFGKVIAHTGRDFDFQFSTKFYDPDIDMYYYGYRYYSPELRRWASPDPIGEAGGLNLYGFCGNDGVNGVDAYGNVKYEGRSGDTN
ncbi:MAG: RHS repeat-associated core domain-containing protein, partial [Kiritimatiellae bacterium]|nr:RHS repeat-associated core domain-containing protein [Kiritimatiellia bacterium]